MCLTASKGVKDTMKNVNRLTSWQALIALSLFVCLIAGAPAATAEETPALYPSIRDVFLGANTFPTVAEGLKQLGLDAVEVNLGRDFSVQSLDSADKLFLKTDDDAKVFKAKADALGIRIPAILTACDFSAGVPEENMAFIARSIEIADLLGASAVRVDSAMSKERELDFGTRVEILGAGLKGALDRTTTSKVTLGIENHGFQGNNLAFLLNLFKAVGSDRMGATLDTGNFYWRGYPLSEVYGILTVLAPYAKHTHVKNIKYPEEKREITREAGWEYGQYMAPLDEGDINITRVVKILREAGYQGDICIEDESLSKCKTPEERIAVLGRNVACVRAAIAAAQ